MATTTLTMNPQLVTIPANTSEHDIDFATLMEGRSEGIAIVKHLSGSFQVNSSGIAITAAAATLTTDNDKAVIGVRAGRNIRMKGAAGSETFMISIVHE